MGPLDRGLLTVYSLAVTVFLLLAASFLVGWPPPGVNADLFRQRPDVTFTLLGLFVLLGIRLFWVAVRPEKKRSVVHEGALGQVRIALTAIEDLVEKVVLQQAGVREARARVTTIGGGIGIILRVAVTPDVSIPQISGLLQEHVRQKVLEVTGVAVQEVRLLVGSITAQKPRVE